MPVVLSSTVKAAGESDDQPIRHPRIGIRSLFYDGTVTASSEATDYPKENATDALDWDWWEPTSLPAWIAVEAGSAKDVTYLGVAAHDFATQGNTITPQYSTDGGSTWQDAASAFLPGSNEPIMFIFDKITAQDWRLYIENGSIPQVGIVQVGRALAMQRPIYQGHAPMSLSRQTDIRPNRAEGGSRLGRSIIRRGNATSASFENLSAQWVRDHLDPFIKMARTYPFFWAWRPNTFSDEVGWGWVNDDIVPENSGPRNLMSVSFDIVGVAYGDS